VRHRTKGTLKVKYTELAVKSNGPEPFFMAMWSVVCALRCTRG
jgi:hypothetical protein